MDEITPPELQAELRSEMSPTILDVREAEELEISRLPDLIHIPLHELPDRMNELDPAGRYVVVCRSGARSGQATAFLLHHGFQDVRNLSFGMNGWARMVDPSLPQY